MSEFHHYCEYGDLGSMIVDLNCKIRRLNSYLSQTSQVESVSSLTTITDLSSLGEKLAGTKKLELDAPIMVYKLKYNNIEDVIQGCAKSEKCVIVERIWRECRDKCNEVNNVILSMMNAVNRLKENTVTSATQISMLICVFDSKKSSFGSLIEFTDVENIYKTIKGQYEPKSICKDACKCLACVLAAVLIAIFVCVFFCSCSNNKVGENGDANKEECVADSKPNSSSKTKGNDIKCRSLLLYIIDKNIGIQSLLLNDSVLVLDSAFILKSEYKYFKPDSSINRIIIIPTEKCGAIDNCKKDDCSLWSHVFRLFAIIILAGALIMILLMLRRQWEKENEMNQKILNERLKVQNEWQEILQSRYRLAIRQQEMELNLEEKERKTQIEDSVRCNEYGLKKQMEEQEQKYNLMSKALDLFQTVNSQSDVSSKQIAELCEQIRNLNLK